jgi:ParB-like chromosome segregation protein Spo0J
MVFATDESRDQLGALESHPIADLFPMMTDAEFEGLRESIAANGQREPVILHEGRIVDGRNRYRACRHLGIPVKVRDWDRRGSLTAFIADQNWARRHLSDTQRAMLAVQLKQAFEEEARANMSRGGQGLADLPSLQARDRAAAAVGVSSRLVGDAIKVTNRAAPELVAAVRRDEVAVSAAADVVALDSAEQAALVARGPAAVRDKATQLRAAKAKKRAARPGDASKRPDDAASVSAVKAGEEGLLPPPGWLEGFPLRSRLKAPAPFDCLATLWWVAQRLLARYGLRLGEGARRGLAVTASFDPDLLDLARLTEDPARWTACVSCAGAGREEEDACCSCHGRGFLVAQVGPTAHRVGRSSPAPAPAESGRRTRAAKGVARRARARGA